MCKNQQHLLEYLTKTFLILKRAKANKARSYSQKISNTKLLSQTLISIGLSIIFFSLFCPAQLGVPICDSLLCKRVYTRMKEENFWGFIILIKMLAFICIWIHCIYFQNTLVSTSGNKLGPWQWTLLEVYACLVLPTWWHWVGGGHIMRGFSTLWLNTWTCAKRKQRFKPTFSLLSLQKSLALQLSSAFQYWYSHNGRLHQ